MPTIKVKKSFKFAEGGIDVIEYAEGDVKDVSDECAKIAVAEKWAEIVKAKKEPEQTAATPEPVVSQAQIDNQA